MNRLLLTSAVCLAGIGIIGCGSGTRLGNVTGTVTLDGKPLEGVSVAFMPEQGGVASGVTDASGKYELTHTDGKGAPVGKNKVAVTTIKKSASTVDMSQIPSDSPEYEKMMKAGGADYAKQVKEPIPEKYNAKTELEFDVKSGSQVIDLKLTSN
jgi:hypothetical protein